MSNLGARLERGWTSAPAKTDEALSQLRSLPLFAEVPEDILTSIAEQTSFVDAAADAVLFRQGELPDSVFILLDGQVVLEAVATGGVKTIVEILAPLEVFQLAASLTDAPCLTSARILSRARLLAIPAAFLRQLIADRPRLAATMLTSVARHYRMLLHQVKDLKLRSAAQRLGCFVLALGREQDFPERIKLPFDKQHLAARLGTTPENLSRAFATLRAHGVATSGAYVIVTDPLRLAAFSVPDEIV